MTSTNSDTSSTLSAQTIAGIVIGVVAGVAMVAAACIYLQRWRRSRGRFTRLRKGMRVADPEEEFMSRGSSISFPSRRTGYGHGQQPSVSLEPLLLSPPHTSQDIPVVPIPPDWSYLPPALPNTPTDPSYLTLYDTEDPFARIQRAILPTHHIPVAVSSASRRVSHEVPANQFSNAKTPGANSPLFINRTLTRPSGPDFFSPRTPTSSFSSADPSHIQSIPSPSRVGDDAVHTFANTDADANRGSPKPQIPALSPLTEKTKTILSEIDANSPESIYSQESAQHPSHPPEPQLPTQPQPPPQSPRRGRTSQRYSKKLKSPELSPVLEASSSASGHGHGNNVSELDKQPSRTFSELDRSSSLSVALSHGASSTTPEGTSTSLPLPLPLLSSTNAFGKTGSGSGSSASTATLSPASSRATRYPSLANSTSTPSSSNSNPHPHPHPHSDPAAEWHRPPAGLGALKHLQLDLPSPNLQFDLPNPHSDLLPNPHSHPTPTSTPKTPTLPQPLLIADKKWKREEPLHTQARLRAHSPGCVPEVEQRSMPIVQCGIASIDVTLWMDRWMDTL
ncbi:hypothetical protein DEU56DRAFT_758661 [Suillus clintonianus]|uniref:uncharacterized protein n=1 Tax=Suillus clintonianus TaxID=1904413 RepID=UPI001B882A3E|nr:uncharacterized protein DEU56DRAFT_758661 [Suillus clintonianus]KAG2127219.1 hypothetical protein DEU56DRAFT_758661 [Suillus clintonianus]